jgi:pyocin large subunit-like protein
MEPKAAAPSPALGAASPRKVELVHLRMKAHDVAASGRAVVTILEDLGAGKIERAHSEGMDVVTANLQTKRLKELLEKLGSVGEPEEGTIPAKDSEETVALQIEILKK